ncbi:hypothetical protein AVEN_51851-1 [Araneus ventricosus]|uniref:Uncharacterized protein n=1 Tax=Araneus ventricosus TaxID=182803 RepID=A0A4Y2QNM7_ARAVE|nr:hypothetical protein AVEN_51851-1 [Araneus ventricosus]
MTRTTPELAPPSPNCRATPTGGRLATTYDLACNRPHTRRIFSGIGFRTCDPPNTSWRSETLTENFKLYCFENFLTTSRRVKLGGREQINSMAPGAIYIRYATVLQHPVFAYVSD